MVHYYFDYTISFEILSSKEDQSKIWYRGKKHTFTSVIHCAFVATWWNRTHFQNVKLPHCAKNLVGLVSSFEWICKNSDNEDSWRWYT